ncbi:glycosyltransferase family 4 protein [Vibrio maritimus]
MPLNPVIWLLLDSRSFGGIETHVLELAKGLLAHNYQVKVVFSNEYHPVPPLETALNQCSISTMTLSREYPNIHPLLRLKEAISRSEQHNQRPAVIHTHGYKGSLLARVTRLIGYTNSIRIVSSFHAGETPKGRVKLYDALDRFSAFLSEQRICVSRTIQSKLPYRSILVKNFVPKAPLVSLASRSVAFVGRLSEEKGPDTFIEMATHFPGQDFHIYGSGPMETLLKEIAPPNVQFHGHQSNMNEVWQSVDLLLITSRYEGLPMAALEAMSRGIPVISFELGELPSVIDTGSNGWITSCPEDMRDTLNNWFSLSDAKRSQIKYHAQQTIELNYSTDVVIPTMLGVYGLKA